MTKVEVFPVPWGMTPDQAFMECQTFGRFHGYRWWKPKFWFMRWSYTVTEISDEAS